MNRLLETIIVAAVAAGISSTAWSQTDQGGTGAGAAGGAGAPGSGGAGGAAGVSSGVGTASSANGAVNAAATEAAAAQGNAEAPGAGGNTQGVSGAAGLQQNDRRPNQLGRAGQRQNAGAVGTFNGINQRPFFGDRGVRKQLNLNENQFNQLNQFHQRAFQQYNQAMGQLDPNLNPAQRAQQMEQLELQYNQDFGQNLNTTLNNPQTRSRFDQLNRQYQGFNAFNDPSVRNQLNITPEQQRQLRKISYQWREEAQRSQRSSGQNNGNTSQPNDLRSQYMNKLTELLTPEQRDSWAQMTGDAYDFQSQNFFPEQDETGNGVNQGQGQVPVGQPAGNNVQPNPANVNQQQPDQNQGPQNQGSKQTPEGAAPGEAR